MNENTIKIKNIIYRKTPTILPEAFAAFTQLSTRSLSPMFLNKSAKWSSSSSSSTSSPLNLSVASQNDSMLDVNCEPTMPINSNISDILNHTTEIRSILTEINMTKYIERFVENEIDIIAFCLLEIDDLHELEIDEGDVIPMLDAVKLYSELFDINPETLLA